MSTLWVAVLVWLARIGAIYGGSWMGAWFGGTPPEHRLRVWQGMVTQVPMPSFVLTPYAPASWNVNGFSAHLAGGYASQSHR